MTDEERSLLKHADIRLLALDLDGTLLTKNKQFNARTEEALRAAIEQKLLVVIVTGRPMGGLPDKVMSVPGIRYVISSNGAMTQDLIGETVMRRAVLERQAAKEIVEMPMERNLIHSVFIGGLGYCEKPFFDMQWERFQNTPSAEYVKKSRRSVEDIAAFICQSDEGIENIWIRANDRGERDYLDEQVRSLYQVQTVLTASTDVEIGNPSAEKGLALMQLADELRIGKDQILAIGDNENDLGMIDAAGIGVVMGNANDTVKQAADILTASNDEDGAAAVIEQLLR